MTHKDRGGSRLAYVEPRASAPELVFVARAPLVAVSLARDGDRFWTCAQKANEIVAFHI